MYANLPVHSVHKYVRTYATCERGLLTFQCEPIAFCMPLSAIEQVLCEPTRPSADIGKEQQLISTEDTALQSKTMTSISTAYHMHHTIYGMKHVTLYIPLARDLCVHCIIIMTSKAFEVIMIRSLCATLEAQVTIEDQKKWDGKGSPPGTVGKVAPLTISIARLTDLQTDLTDLQTD